MLPRARGDPIELSPARGKGLRVAAARTEQQPFHDVPEMKPHAAAVRATMLAALVPDDIGLGGEPPSLHDSQALGKQGVRHPQREMRHRRRELRQRQPGDLSDRRGPVAGKSPVFGRYFAGAVLELPRRIGQTGVKLMSLIAARRS
jgi:hypothetical protein